MLVVGFDELAQGDVRIAVTGIAAFLWDRQLYGVHRTGMNTGHAGYAPFWIILAFLRLDGEAIHRTDLSADPASDAVFADHEHGPLCIRLYTALWFVLRIWRQDEAPACIQVCADRIDLRRDVFVCGHLFLYIRCGQKAVRHHHGIDIGRIYAQAKGQLKRLLGRFAIVAPVSEDHVEIRRIEMRVMQKCADQLGDLLCMHRTDDADLRILIRLRIIVDGLCDADAARIQPLCHIQAVPSGRKIKQHGIFSPFLTAANMGD